MVKTGSPLPGLITAFAYIFVAGLVNGGLIIYSLNENSNGEWNEIKKLIHLRRRQLYFIFLRLTTVGLILGVSVNWIFVSDHVFHLLFAGAALTFLFIERVICVLYVLSDVREVNEYEFVYAQILDIEMSLSFWLEHDIVMIESSRHDQILRVYAILLSFPCAILGLYDVMLVRGASDGKRQLSKDFNTNAAIHLIFSSIALFCNLIFIMSVRIQKDVFSLNLRKFKQIYYDTQSPLEARKKNRDANGDSDDHDSSTNCCISLWRKYRVFSNERWLLIIYRVCETMSRVLTLTVLAMVSFWILFFFAFLELCLLTYNDFFRGRVTWERLILHPLITDAMLSVPNLDCKPKIEPTHPQTSQLRLNDVIDWIQCWNVSTMILYYFQPVRKFLKQKPICDGKFCNLKMDEFWLDSNLRKFHKSANRVCNHCSTNIEKDRHYFRCPTFLQSDQETYGRTKSSDDHVVTATLTKTRQQGLSMQRIVGLTNNLTAIQPVGGMSGLSGSSNHGNQAAEDHGRYLCEHCGFQKTSQIPMIFATARTLFSCWWIAIFLIILDQSKALGLTFLTQSWVFGVVADHSVVVAFTFSTLILTPMLLALIIRLDLIEIDHPTARFDKTPYFNELSIDIERTGISQRRSQKSLNASRISVKMGSNLGSGLAGGPSILGVSNQPHQPSAEDERANQTLLQLAKDKEWEMLAHAVKEFKNNSDVLDTPESSKGRTLAMLAAEVHHMSLLRTLLNLGAEMDKTVDINSLGVSYFLDKPLTESRKTATTQACFSGAVADLHLCLRLGCDVRKKDASGLNPLHTAAKEGELECIQVLIDHLDESDDVEYIDNDLGASDKRLKYLNEKCVLFDGMTALMFAACYGQMKAVELLLQLGSDFEMKDDSNPPKTAMQYALESQEKDCARVIHNFMKAYNDKYAAKIQRIEELEEAKSREMDAASSRKLTYESAL